MTPMIPNSFDDERLIAAIDSAPLDQDVLTIEEAQALDAQIAEGHARIARGERPYREFDVVSKEVNAASRAG